MALGRSPPPEIRSPDAAEEGAEAEAEGDEEVFDDAFDIPHKNAPHDRLRRWRVRARSTRPSPVVSPSNLDLRRAGQVGDLDCVMRAFSLDLEMVRARAAL